MKINTFFAVPAVVLASQVCHAQSTDQKLNPIVENFVNETNNHTQLEDMAFELLDGIGPRLVGTPELLKSN